MKTFASAPDLKVKKEKSKIFKNIILDKTKSLKVTKLISTFEVTRKFDAKTKTWKMVSKELIGELESTDLSFNLLEVSKEQLSAYRKSDIPSFVLKVDGKLYYSKIPNNLNFFSATILGTHKCSKIDHECRRLSSATDENGGCAKVRGHSKCIENYPWITKGYETFNTKKDTFMVAECDHFLECLPRKKFSTSELVKIRSDISSTDLQIFKK